MFGVLSPRRHRLHVAGETPARLDNVVAMRRWVQPSESSRVSTWAIAVGVSCMSGSVHLFAEKFKVLLCERKCAYAPISYRFVFRGNQT
jgi:hypothetical protein